ncbi:MAG: hypothetical protein H6843_11440 [Rhodospirillaceae bacterium]|nr:hypothetical protein [Rhodospirillaceae bacterium]
MRRLIAWVGRIVLVTALTAMICVAVLLGYGYAITRPAPVAAYAHPASARDVGPALAALRDGDGRLDPAATQAAFAAVADRLEGVRLVMVPSYFYDLLRAPNAIGIGDYMTDQRAWLEAQGLATEITAADTEAAVATNAAALVRLVRESGRPVCFVSHSKGGLEVLAALIALAPAERARVRCWIALQAPFSGSPLADVWAGDPLGRRFVFGLLELMGGSAQSLVDLTTPVRRADLARHDRAIAEVVAEVPVLAVAARLTDRDDWRATSPFDLLRQWMEAGGAPGDGAVPVESAILPHARYVVLEGLDHGDTVDGDRPFGPVLSDDVALIQALFALVLDAE